MLLYHTMQPYHSYDERTMRKRLDSFCSNLKTDDTADTPSDFLDFETEAQRTRRDYNKMASELLVWTPHAAPVGLVLILECPLLSRPRHLSFVVTMRCVELP
jgi:hypothetical protein